MKNAIVILLALIIFSCSSSHKIHINSDNSAEVEFQVTNKLSLVETLSEMAMIQNNKDFGIVDTKQVKKDLEKEKYISDVAIISDKENSYKGSLKVDDINNLFSDATKDIPKELQIFSLSENNGIKQLKIQISLDNYEFLKKTIPLLQDESIDIIGPVSNQDVTKEEYLDMISFSLGDQGPEDILSSFIDLEISVDGVILNVIGGQKLNSNLAAFNIPLIDLILLQKTYTYSLTYK